MKDKEVFNLAIELPISMFTDESLDRLRLLVENKSKLFKKAFGAEDLPIDILEDRLSFPWFKYECTAKETQAYTDFISALASLAIKQKRINRTGQTIENEKYALRTFLLRLGLIGDEYKETRKILLKNLKGSSSYREKHMEV